MSKAIAGIIGDEWKISVEEICRRYGTNVTSGLSSAQAKLNKKQYSKKDKDDKTKKSKEDKKKDKKSKDGKTKDDKKNYGDVSVNRDGKITTLSSKKLVVGDIVELTPGMQVPADLRILVSNGIQADTSVVTGAGTGGGAVKQLLPDCTNENPLETSNLALAGYKILNGTGKAIVISVIGDKIASKYPKLAPFIPQALSFINPQNPNPVNQQFPNQNPGVSNTSGYNPTNPNPTGYNPNLPNPAIPNHMGYNPNQNPMIHNPNAPNPYGQNPSIPNPFPHNPNMQNPGFPPNPNMQNPGFPPNPNMQNPGFPPNPNMQNPGFPPNPNMQNPGFPPNPNMQNPGYPPNPNMQNPGFPPNPNSTMGWPQQR
ncbi:uncharacterized protein LOC110857661 [Folsomia candida]|uniref:Sodium/potassium-transporting ATPase subunit alpha-A n=1 Tax=Folsomia candida TaxID=158441 RepID=A0A226F4Q6_FOLCA|nr:uncharacterized protein LOC110857661 [Folsomia candida]OXA64782.1 Sodium/potassium-transporting ATPase subunit alpha-A [Folsomia candida]